jgi:glycosyltransferase involved in cell wall biosynthesis
VLRVVHLPSNPLLKGTDLIAEPLEALARAGKIELIVARNLPHEDVMRLYASADVVLDQFRMGIYGVAAVEAMGFGCLVMSDVAAGTRRTVLERTGLELPIAQASGRSIAQALCEVIEHPDRYRRLAQAGWEFVGAVHDGARSAAALAGALELGDAPTG